MTVLKFWRYHFKIYIYIYILVSSYFLLDSFSFLSFFFLLEYYQSILPQHCNHALQPRLLENHLGEKVKISLNVKFQE